MSELKRYSSRTHGVHMDGTMDCMMAFSPKDGEWVPFEDALRLESERDEAREEVKAHRECDESRRALVREIDVIISGEDGAAKQASLCDLVGPIRDVVKQRDEARAVLRAWHNLFGTTQLTHAIAAKESVEGQRDAALRDLTAARAEIARLKALVDALKADGFKILEDYEPKGEQEGTL